MPRYLKSTRRVYVPKKKWSPLFGGYSFDLVVPTGDKGAIYSESLAVNSNSTSPATTVIKVGRFKVKSEVFVPTNSAVNSSISFQAYIMFRPQNMQITSNYPSEHPEYILAWSSPSFTASSGFSMSSKLKRNLNSGDSVIVLYVFTNMTNTTVSGKLKCIYSCVACNN